MNEVVKTMSLQQPVTEESIAQYLLSTPDFFERQAALLAKVQLHNPHGGKAVSLPERQALMLREKIKNLEHRIVDMVQASHENTAMNHKLQSCLAAWLSVRDAADLPQVITHSLQTQFALPQAVLRLWHLPMQHHGLTCAQTTSAEVQTLVQDLFVGAGAYCGGATQVAMRSCLPSDFAVASWAIVPLEIAPTTIPADTTNAVHGACCGLLLLASDERERFVQDMGLDFLQQLSALAAAALSRLYV